MALKREKDRLVHQLKQQVGRHSFSYFHGNRKLALFSFVLFYSDVQLEVLKPGLTRDSSCKRQDVFHFSVYCFSGVVKNQLHVCLAPIIYSQYILFSLFIQFPTFVILWERRANAFCIKQDLSILLTLFNLLLFSYLLICCKIIVFSEGFRLSERLSRK